VRSDGRMEGYVPLPRLASREGYLFELLATPASSTRRWSSDRCS